MLQRWQGKVLQERIAGNLQITTNETHILQEWCDFLHTIALNDQISIYTNKMLQRCKRGDIFDVRDFHVLGEPTTAVKSGDAACAEIDNGAINL